MGELCIHRSLTSSLLLSTNYLPSRVPSLKTVIYLKGKQRKLSLREKHDPSASRCAMPPPSEGHPLLTWGEMLSSHLKIICFCRLLSIWQLWGVVRKLLLISLPRVSWVFFQSSLVVCDELSFPNASDWKCMPGDNCKTMLLCPVTSSVPAPRNSLRVTDAKWWHRSTACFIRHVT